MNESAGFELVMNADFVKRLHEGIERAHDRIYIQVMTFDGDDAGLGVAERLIAAAARGVDVQITVDTFAFRYISDVRSTKDEVADEVRATHEMFDRMEAAGVSIVYVRPFGRLLQWGLFRNHKKIFVLDDVGYVGGINISDHNFEWLDFKVSIVNSKLVDILAADFAATRLGNAPSLSGPVITNEHIETTFVDLLESAEKSVLIASPYALDAVLAERLIASPVASKVVVAPEENNFMTFRLTDPYIRKKMRDGGVDVRTFTDFFHAKFAVFDDERIFVGSSNFGLHSFRCNQEIGMVIDDPTFVQTLTKALPSTAVVSTATSPLQYAIGAGVSSAIRAGTAFFGKVVSPYAPTITTR